MLCGIYMSSATNYNSGFEAFLPNKTEMIPIKDFVRDSNCALKTSKGLNIERLNENIPDSSSFINLNYGIIPMQGLYAIIGNRLIGMDMERNCYIDELLLPDSIVINDFVALKNLIVFKSGSAIITLKANRELDGWLIDAEDFNIGLYTDSTIAIYYKGHVFECAPLEKTMKPLFSVGEYNILSCVPTGENETIIITNNYILRRNMSKLLPIFRFHEKAKAAIYSTVGSFYGNYAGLFEINDDGKILQLLNIPVSNIIDDGEVVYIITEKGIIYRIHS